MTMTGISNATLGRISHRIAVALRILRGRPAVPTARGARTSDPRYDGAFADTEKGVLQ